MSMKSNDAVANGRLPPRFSHGAVPLVMFLLAMSLLVLLSNVLAQWWLGPDPSRIAQNVWNMGSGLVQAALVVGFLRFEGVRARDLAASRRDFVAALAAIGAFIVVLNVVVLVVGILGSGSVDFGVFALYRRPPLDLSLAAVGVGLVTQYVFVGPVEELAFRGYLQNKLIRLIGGADSRFLTIVGVVGAGALFSVMHVPTLLVLENAAPSEVLISLTGLAASGVAFGALYVLTRNLFLVAFLHGIGNFWPLVVDPGAGAWPNWIVVAVLYVGLVWAFRSWRSTPTGG